EIPLGRPYRTQPNGVLKMMTTRKRVRALPSGRLASRYPPDHSSLDHFSSDSLSNSSSYSYHQGLSLLDSSFSFRDSSFNTTGLLSADHLTRGVCMGGFWGSGIEFVIDEEADVGVKVGIGIEREDEVEEEAKTEDKGTIEIGVDGVLDMESAQRDQGRRMLVASE
ncbi:hypothetical protein Tco_1058895, partial [Tanacetum coccineum]